MPSGKDISRSATHGKPGRAKFINLQDTLREEAHFSLSDILDVVPPRRPSIEPSKIYKYVEIERIGIGEYDYAEYRGWELPDRAKLNAKVGDIFIASIWSSAGKWCIAAGDCENVIFTNGCTHLRLKEGKEEYLPDLVVGLCSEAFCVQMRALATGSDGLAEIAPNDLLSILIPRTIEPEERTKVEQQLKSLLSGESRFVKFAKGVIEATEKFPSPPLRKSHCSLV